MFQRGEQVSPELTIQFPIKSGANADTFRVRDGKGHLFFMKMFHRDRLGPDDLTDKGTIREIEMLRQLEHPGLIRYAGAGTLATDKGDQEYLLSKFVSGETVQDRLRRDLTIDPSQARRLVIEVLQALAHLHGQAVPISHNEISDQNVMLDLSTTEPRSVVIDLGHARRKGDGIWYPKLGQDPYYMAPETYNDGGSPAADVFSVAVLYYHMLFGIPPWYLNISQFQAQHRDIHSALEKERRKSLKFLQLRSGLSIEASDLKVISQALSLSPASRFETAEEFLQALTKPQKIKPDTRGIDGGAKSSRVTLRNIKRGFDAVAGMDELKDLLLRDVVMAIKDREGYESYGIPIPNGMLFYGPPGCGKTFVAERFAEEVGLNFRSIKPSDLASIYVHGTQEKIGELFREAREHAPTILFFDELDALLPNRDNNLGHSYASEVNEFLAQMGNCSKDGVFMIGATNRPDLIDPAVLRTGRMDKIIYIPPPDMEARRAMFQLHLESRPQEGQIDFVALAAETEGRVASDIEFLVNEAARMAYVQKAPIGQEHLVNAIKQNRPSVSIVELGKYAEMKKRLESGSDQRQRQTIGFQATKTEEHGKG